MITANTVEAEIVSYHNKNVRINGVHINFISKETIQNICGFCSTSSHKFCISSSNLGYHLHF